MKDSFILVWRRAQSFDPRRGTAMAWLARIVRNPCFDLMRRRRRAVAARRRAHAKLGRPGAGPGRSDGAQPGCPALWACLDELDEGPRKSRVPAYYEGLTFAEVAGRVGGPLGTVKSWIRRGLIQLRGCMER